MPPAISQSVGSPVSKRSLCQRTAAKCRPCGTPTALGVCLFGDRTAPWSYAQRAREGVLYAVRARRVFWGDFVDLPTDSTVKCMCF